MATQEVEQKAESDEEMDSAEDSDSDDETNPRLEELEKIIHNNPYQYDSHVEYINLLREVGELEKLREARENMNKYHPLSEELWLQWLGDEVKLLSEDCSREKMYELFDRATKDYLSVPIWLEYVQFTIGGIGTEDGMNRCREVFERALSAVGLHVSQGSNIWEAYREFETTVLGLMNPELGGNDEKTNRQMDRITNLFKRQLALPLLNLKETFKEYIQWVEDDGKSMKSTYDKTMKKLDHIKPFENKLISSPDLSTYNEYLDYELKQGEPPRIQCLFERAIKDHCLVPDIWIRYLTYLDETIKVESIILPIYNRAIRNCGWSVDIWLRYIRALERHNKPHSDVQGIFEQSLTAGFSEASPYLMLWTGYCDYMRRRIDWQKEHDKELDSFRVTIERGIQHLYQLFGNDGDPMCTLHQYWADIEARYCQNMTKARELWSEIMSRGHGNEAKMWLEYLTLERSHGDCKHCRKLLNRAVNSVTDWPEVICEAYINYERVVGTLSDYDGAVSRCKAQLERIELRRQQQMEKEEQMKGSKGSKSKKEHEFRPRNVKLGKSDSGKSLKKEGKNLSEKKVGSKRKQEELSDEPPEKAAKSNEGFKVPLVPVKPIPTPAVQSKSQPEHVDTSDKSEEEKSETTVFVSNLAYDVTVDRLKTAFGKCGDITSVRLALSKGKSRGFGYVEFKDSIGVAAALSLDRSLIDSRPMFVSAYRQKHEHSKFKYETSMEKNKLFISNLPATCTKDALETIFKQHGEIRDVRIVTNRSGVPKGIAFVEFVRAEDASQAVMKTDGLTIGGQEIGVAISNPPARKSPHQETPSAEFTPTLGGGKKETGRSKAHTMVSFMPRSVQKPEKTAPKPENSAKKAVDKPVDKPVEKPENSDDKSEKPAMKSNADFRSMFLK